MEYVTLNNGVRMPVLGHGVYQIDPTGYERCVAEVLAVGYRSLDTAQAYRNEQGVRPCRPPQRHPRSELFLTSSTF